MSENPPGAYEAHLGMTLRDYFAGQAINGLLAALETTFSASALAKEAFMLADAMLAERERSNG